jgi:putative membrane protein
MSVIGALIGLAIVIVLNALVIYIVGRLNLGLTVDGFGAAVIAAIVISIVSWAFQWLFGFFGFTFIRNPNLIGAIVALIISAVILMISDRFVKGMKVSGFSGAIVAAAAIGVIHWIVSWLVGLIF